MDDVVVLVVLLAGIELERQAYREAMATGHVEQDTAISLLQCYRFLAGAPSRKGGEP